MLGGKQRVIHTPFACCCCLRLLGHCRQLQYQPKQQESRYSPDRRSRKFHHGPEKGPGRRIGRQWALTVQRRAMYLCTETKTTARTGTRVPAEGSMRTAFRRHAYGRTIVIPWGKAQCYAATGINTKVLYITHPARISPPRPGRIFFPDIAEISFLMGDRARELGLAIRRREKDAVVSAYDEILGTLVELSGRKARRSTHQHRRNDRATSALGLRRPTGRRRSLSPEVWWCYAALAKVGHGL